MTAPEPLSEFVDGARHFIRNAHSLNVTVSARNAERMLRTVKGYVRPEPALNAAFDDAIGRIAEFHEEIVDQNTLKKRSLRGSRMRVRSPCFRLTASLPHWLMQSPAKEPQRSG